MNDSQSLVVEMRSKPLDARSNNSEVCSTVLCSEQPEVPNLDRPFQMTCLHPKLNQTCRPLLLIGQNFYPCFYIDDLYIHVYKMTL
ncbi:hypothetical protein RHMOL_Rhmol13G0241100 [Rhododendron molle]|nr:hypothetical protein RHMOL_Rhmol13G0241100 [Rhododendron molle]